ncbi:serine hydrolase-domain-containing protein [Protomyces lactucae-debilis]|uniref:dihydrofolate reductase n=1 Tax=Protomyces lactucae-debilis TaxID=2754530 RepID=A0A1Y2EZP2_PROLT|nr:serine hydrolase-domain-containing protein [Protomyces lactucae-debilis]ORY76586.1 serine hydrolase-domain-containing protein [Protomyces lactucae-debilis]
MAPARILFLHGYTQSGNTLRHKTGALSKSLGKFSEIVYPTGPHQLEMPDPSDPEERARLEKLDNEEGEGSFAWWRANDEDFIGLPESLALIKDVLETQGPFDGVMGFSQGGGFAAMLASLLERSNPLFKVKHPPFKFAVIFSGFRSRFPQYDYLYEPAIKTPMLHVIGRNDPIVTPERSQMLVDASKNNTLLLHPGSHFVPSGAPQRNVVVDYIVNHIRPKREITCIVAATNTQGIGRDGGLPWRLRKEMAYFAAVTTAAPEGKMNVCIMGRNSWESIPEKFRPLKNRINIIVTSNQQYELTGLGIHSQKTALATSLEDALLVIHKLYADIVHHVFCIGGAQLYKAALAHPDTQRLLLTRIDRDYDCDTYFPDFSRTGEWQKQDLSALQSFAQIDVQASDEEKDIKWSYEIWERKQTTTSPAEARL